MECRSHNLKQVSENLYECTKCGAEAEGWLQAGGDCPPPKKKPLLQQFEDGIRAGKKGKF